MPRNAVAVRNIEQVALLVKDLTKIEHPAGPCRDERIVQRPIDPPDAGADDANPARLALVERAVQGTFKAAIRGHGAVRKPIAEYVGAAALGYAGAKIGRAVSLIPVRSKNRPG